MGKVMHYDEDDFQLEMLSAGVNVQLGQADEPPPAHGCVPPDVYDELTETCVAPCPPGMMWDAAQGLCVEGVEPPRLPGDFVAPGAVKVRPNNWDLEGQPYATYKLAWGDTYVGLSATYLGDGARWREIWDLNRTITPNPDAIYVSQVINMPDEARDKLKRWLVGPKDKPPGELPKTPTVTEQAKRYGPWVVAGAAALYVGYELMKG